MFVIAEKFSFSIKLTLLTMLSKASTRSYQVQVFNTQDQSTIADLFLKTKNNTKKETTPEPNLIPILLGSQ